jgi:hypothetical protein
MAWHPKDAPLDCQPLLDKCRPVDWDIGSDDNAIQPRQWRPVAQARAEVIAARVLALSGWADRLLIISYCLWVLVAAWKAIKLRRKNLKSH